MNEHDGLPLSRRSCLARIFFIFSWLFEIKLQMSEWFSVITSEFVLNMCFYNGNTFAFIPVEIMEHQNNTSLSAIALLCYCLFLI